MKGRMDRLAKLSLLLAVAVAVLGLGLQQFGQRNDSGTVRAHASGITIDAFMNPLMPRPVSG